MTDNEIIGVLGNFFLQEFANDAPGVAEWLSDEGVATDTFVKLIEARTHSDPITP